MKITFDTAGKGFFARLGDLILNKFDGSDGRKSEAIAVLTHAVSLVANRLGALSEPDGDIEGFYAAWKAHRHAGFAATQTEADKVAEMYGVKAPPLADDTAIHQSWFDLFEFLNARGVSGSGDHGADAIDYIKSLETIRDAKAAS